MIIVIVCGSEEIVFRCVGVLQPIELALETR